MCGFNPGLLAACQMLGDHACVDLILGSRFCSVGVGVGKHTLTLDPVVRGPEAVSVQGPRCQVTALGPTALTCML